MVSKHVLTDCLRLQLCNAGGTNKRSPCERKHTTDQYEYDFLSEPLGDDKTITFSVKANNDAHVGFFDNQETNGAPRDVQGQYTIDLGAQYEIVICGWGGTQSVIREEAQGDAKALTDTTGYLDANDYRQFWASAANGLIRVGAGNDVGTHVFLVFQDPNDILTVNWAAVATGWGSEGDWIVCIPEKCTGTHDAVTAELSGMEVCDGVRTQAIKKSTIALSCLRLIACVSSVETDATVSATRATAGQARPGARLAKPLRPETPLSATNSVSPAAAWLILSTRLATP